MATSDPQRAYRAPCPGCGAPVLFRSAQSAYAVCGYCQSTVVRQGEVLSRIGKMAELFDDFSPLQLMASGVLPGAGPDNARRFTLVGRLQYQSDSGPWTEWHALFEADGTSGMLGEDNGAFVFSRAASPTRELPSPEHLRVGSTTAIDGKLFTVTANRPVTLVSAQGELPHLPALGRPFPAVELRAGDGEVLTIEYGGGAPMVSRGRAVALEELQLTGLKDGSTREEKGRQFDCPNCGAPVTVQLATTRSVTCGSCRSLIDLSKGIGAELAHAEQDEPVRPLIGLGTQGKMQGVVWQVVGFQHRLGREPQDDELFGWSEYLLFNDKRGFSFLVDSTEGWSLVRPTTGAPQMKQKNSRTARYLGTNYQLKYSYNAETDYALGEFYWPVVRGQKSFNRDFVNGERLLNLEQTPTELTWSVGGMVASRLVADSFGVDEKKTALAKSDVKPFSADPSVSTGLVIAIFLLLVFVSFIMSTCSDSGGSGRTSGGSFGGYSSGGGHK